MVVLRACGEKGMEGYCLMDTIFSLDDEKVLEMACDYGCTQCEYK